MYQENLALKKKCSAMQKELESLRRMQSQSCSDNNSDNPHMELLDGLSCCCCCWFPSSREFTSGLMMTDLMDVQLCCRAEPASRPPNIPRLNLGSLSPYSDEVSTSYDMLLPL